MMNCFFSILKQTETLSLSNFADISFTHRRGCSTRVEMMSLTIIQHLCLEFLKVQTGYTVSSLIVCLQLQARNIQSPK